MALFKIKHILSQTCDFLFTTPLISDVLLRGRVRAFSTELERPGENNEVKQRFACSLYLLLKFLSAYCQYNPPSLQSGKSSIQIYCRTIRESTTTTTTTPTTTTTTTNLTFLPWWSTWPCRPTTSSIRSCSKESVSTFYFK